MNYLKQLAGQTFVYGLGIVIPRILNYILLTPFYTRVFSKGEYGIITELYAYVVFLIVILTYGLETGFFRFADKRSNKEHVYKTALISIGFSTLLFLIFGHILYDNVAIALDYEQQKYLLLILAWIVGLDAFSSIPFARIRLDDKAKKYAVIRIIEVLVNIFFNWFFIWFCAKNHTHYQILNYIYNPEIGVGYVLISNLIATIVKTLLLYREILINSGRFIFPLWKKILRYSFPLLIAGLAGTVNEAIDRILLKHLVPAELNPLEQLGIYGANYKLAVLMTLFIQMFRYAAEPFFFARKEESNARQIYADVMKYFIISCIFIFLLVILYIDLFKLFIGPDFRSGLHIVPVVLLANLFMGIYYNLSIWFKLKNLTYYGALMVIFGAMITISVNYAFIPQYGYVASAWGHLISYSAMVLLSYVLGRKYYRIPYDFKNILVYVSYGIFVYLLFKWIDFNNSVFEFTTKTVTLAFLLGIIFLREKKILSGKYIK